MYRITVLVASVLVVGLASPALAEPNADVYPNPVRRGERITVKAKNCQSGTDYKAFVEIRVTKRGTHQLVKNLSVPAESDGTTSVKIKMRTRGRFDVAVTCVHKFDAGGEGVFWDEEETIRVKARSGD